MAFVPCSCVQVLRDCQRPSVYGCPLQTKPDSVRGGLRVASGAHMQALTRSQTSGWYVCRTNMRQ